MKSVRISAEAQNEFIEARIWYERARPELGPRLEQAFVRCLEHLDVSSPLGAGIRRALLDGFPYVVVFEETATEFIVLAFAHSRRRPDYWRDR